MPCGIRRELASLRVYTCLKKMTVLPTQNSVGTMIPIYVAGVGGRGIAFVWLLANFEDVEVVEYTIGILETSVQCT